MKNLTLKASLRIAMGVLVLLSVTTACAAADSRFHIPFQFLMGDKVLPAGDYNVKIDTANQRIELTSWQGSAAVCLSANTPIGAVSGAEPGKLVFHRFGKVTVLRQMWRSGAKYGHELSFSKAEREMVKAATASSNIEIASLGTR
jgi:hypothetical protein